MKTVTIRFEIPDEMNLDYEEIIGTINGSITDMNKEFAENVTYTILQRK